MGLDYYPSVLFETVPQLYDELASDFREAFGGDLTARDLPRLLRFGSWIGGDRDGNPNVTPECTMLYKLPGRQFLISTSRKLKS
jgi:phosphoenolpyruvate carboxylase